MSKKFFLIQISLSYIILLFLEFYLVNLNQKRMHSYKISYPEKLRNDIEKQFNIEREFLMMKGYKNTFLPISADNEKFWPYKFAKELKVYPLSSYPNSFSILCNEGYGTILWKSDKLGFRNENSDYKFSNKSLLIGDSAMQGACVKDEHTISSNLKNIFPNHGFINLGSSSNNPVHYQMLLDEFAQTPKEQNIKNIVILFTENDFDKKINLVTKNKMREIRKNDFYLLEGGEIILSDYGKSFFQRAAYNQDLYIDILNNEELKNFKKSYSKIKNNVDLSNKSSFPDIFVLKELRTFFYKLFNNHDYSSKEAENTIDKAIKYCSNEKCRVIVLFFPFSRFWNPGISLESNKGYLDFMKYINLKLDENKNKNFNFINLKDYFPYMSKFRTEFYGIYGGHPSPKGYSLISDLIFEKLDK